MAAISLGDLARRLDAELLGEGPVEISGVATPESAGPVDVALLTDPARVARAGESAAAAFVVRRPIPGLAAPQLVCAEPARALAILLDLFRPRPSAGPSCGIDPRAAVDPLARVDASAWVGPFCYVGTGALIGAGTRVEPFSYVGAGAVIGDRCEIGPGATVARGCTLEDRVILGPGAVVGYRGFGFYRQENEWRPLRSPAGVRLEREVELGANSCVDGGTLDPTLVQAGAKIDNLVQVGHNAVVGRRALLCGQVGLAGSVAVGDDAILGGQAGIADHLRVGAAARVAAHSGVVQDVVDGATVAGYPAFDRVRWLRSSALFRRLAEVTREVRELRRSLAELLGADARSRG